MDRPKRLVEGTGPEAKIQIALIKFLEHKGWAVMPTHGNIYQQGFPDLYCVHPAHKQRWVEVKYAQRYKFTAAQKQRFPLIDKAVGIWILVDATEAEYAKLFSASNLWNYWK